MVDVWCVQVQVYGDSRMETPVTTVGVDSIGFFDLSPLPNRSEVVLLQHLILCIDHWLCVCVCFRTTT